MHHGTRPRFTFLAKIGAAAALIAAADRLLFDDWLPGATLGVFALVWAVLLAAVRPDVRRSRAAWFALVGAAAFAIAMVDDPGLLDWTLFWVAIASATLLPGHRFDTAIEWGGRLFFHALLGLTRPFRDAARLASARRRGGRVAGAILSLLALPLLGGATFLFLFASANPLIEDAFTSIQVPDFSTGLGHVAFWGVILLAVWPSLRPRGTTLRRYVAEPGYARPPLHVPLATLTLSLVTFNAIFAVQNGLDLAFLWSGAPLPKGVTLADYAHRGAYPLIVTALLAAAFVLVASRPGSDGAQSRLVRGLITVWVAQNLLLVASSILRTLDYIAAYSLTELRIAALAWMGLVAVGLALIVWRMLAGRSIRWLINANAIAAMAVLTAASVSDLGATAATWNVRHAREAGDLDLCYLHQLGPSALLPLVELERRAGGPVLRDRARYLRAEALGNLQRAQRDWHRWTWRGARRLATAQVRLGDHPAAARTIADGRTCDGEPFPPQPEPTASAPPPPAPAPTATPKPSRPARALTNGPRA